MNSQKTAATEEHKETGLVLYFDFNEPPDKIPVKDKSGQDSNVLSRPNALKAGQWHHVASTFDGKIMKVYIDKNVAGQKERTEPIQTNESHLAIGNEPPGFVDETKEPHAFDGWIDEVRIDNRGLSEEEIKALAAKTSEPDDS